MDAKKTTVISIIMPAFNCDKYIQHAIESVRLQSYQNWELIVIDDCSSDNTLEVVRGIAEKDKRIRFFKNEKNIGVSETRNKAISLAQGEWIAFLDSDDIWEMSKLEKQIECARLESAEFVFTGAAYINETGDYYKGIFEVPKKVNLKKLKKQNVISCSSVLIKKKFFKTIKMENDDMHEDYAVWLRVLKKGVIAYGINEPLLIYRISSQSKSGNKIKTFKMTFKVFRFIGESRSKAMFYMLSHVYGSYKKYKKIKIA